MNKKRSKLAKAIGWKQHPDGWWSTPRKQGCASHGLDNPPDPYTDANDCEALIRWLNEQGWTTIISISKSDHVQIIKRARYPAGATFSDTFDDWKQGVCELALMVLEKK